MIYGVISDLSYNNFFLLVEYNDIRTSITGHLLKTVRYWSSPDTQNGFTNSYIQYLVFALRILYKLVRLLCELLKPVNLPYASSALRGQKPHTAWIGFLKTTVFCIRNVLFSAEYVKAYKEHVRCTECPESMLGFQSCVLLSWNI